MIIALTLADWYEFSNISAVSKEHAVASHLSCCRVLLKQPIRKYYLPARLCAPRYEAFIVLTQLLRVDFLLAPFPLWFHQCQWCPVLGLQHPGVSQALSFAQFLQCLNHQLCFCSGEEGVRVFQPPHQHC